MSTAVSHMQSNAGSANVTVSSASARSLCNALSTTQSAGRNNSVTQGVKGESLAHDIFAAKLKVSYPSFCQKLGIISKSSHKSRKTYASALVDGNINLNTIREFLGYMDERTTLNNYCYDRNTDTECKEKIQKALAS